MENKHPGRILIVRSHSHDRIDMPVADKYDITIVWKGMKADKAVLQKVYAKGSILSLSFPNASIQKLYDPQQLMRSVTINGHVVKRRIVDR
jgi:hypothetical protein